MFQLDRIIGLTVSSWDAEDIDIYVHIPFFKALMFIWYDSDIMNAYMTPPGMQKNL